MATAVHQFTQKSDPNLTRRARDVLKSAAVSPPDWRRSLHVLVNALGVIEPKFFQYAIDWYIIPGNLSGLNLLAVVFLVVKLLQFIVSYLQTVMLQSVGQHVMFDLRSELYRKLQHQEVAYFDRNPVGRVMTRLTSDVDTLYELFTSGVIEGLATS